MTWLGRAFIVIGLVGLVASVLLLAAGLLLVGRATSGGDASGRSLIPGVASVIAFAIVLFVGRRLARR